MKKIPRPTILTISKYNLAVRFIVEEAGQLKGMPRALRIRVAWEEVEAEPTRV